MFRHSANAFASITQLLTNLDIVQTLKQYILRLTVGKYDFITKRFRGPFNTMKVI